MNERLTRKDMAARAATLHVGDEVIVIKDGGERVLTKVRREPWQVGCGRWIVGLEGISGGYDLMRVLKCVPIT